MVDSEPVELEEVPNKLLDISDQIANGANETAPMETPSVNVSRTATALMTHAKGVIRRAAAVLMIFYFLGLLIEQ
jgi:hypothetical protein